MARKKSGPVELTVANAPLRDVMSDIVRLDLSHRPFARAGSVIAIRHGGNRVLAVARGPAGVGKTGISLDSATRARLDVKLNKTASFTFEEASLWDELVWAWSATDAMPRVAARLGAISVVLGAVGLFLGIVSLCK
ncbi:hypothetical protein [Sphingobium sp. B2]|uniref:hypothetical protein n=1 Tax=Sphingobium sp. B2 TaxID=2583228 RepID=UPI00119EBE52|nr:hypothetical protein [Sphingobium sp. B2]